MYGQHAARHFVLVRRLLHTSESASPSAVPGIVRHVSCVPAIQHKDRRQGGALGAYMGAFSGAMVPGCIAASIARGAVPEQLVVAIKGCHSLVLSRCASVGMCQDSR